MSAPALRLVASRAETAPPLDGALAWRPAPPFAASSTSEMSLLLAATVTLAVHLAVLAWMAVVPADDAARSAGSAADLILLEGIPVEIVTSLPAPETAPAEATPEAPDPADEPAPQPPAEPIEPPPSEPAVEAPPPEPEATTPPDLSPPVDPSLPPAETETGDLPARPDEPVPAAKPPPPDPATVPAPRRKPDHIEKADAAKPAAPPPSAPSAPASAARSGGAGGGGSAETSGNAAASAYRAEIAAALARKRFYPNAARRDRLTGRATVSFTLNAAGRVTAARVVRSAGARILDDAALEMVRRAAPYPPIPRGLGATITIQAPIGFELPR